jgi:hypothetical protein
VKRIAAALIVAASWAGCTIWDDARLPQKDAVSSSSSGSSSSNSGSSCEKAHPPSTASPDAGSGGDIDIVVVVQSISLGVSGGKVDPTFGFDLDNVCTCKPDKDSCQPGAKKAQCDQNLGIDNGTALLLSTFPIDATQYANNEFALGHRGILARVQNYNGLAHDSDIQFSLYRSTGPGTAPDFTNPDQAWDIDSGDVVLGSNKPAITGSGFVIDHKLVAQLDTSKIPFNEYTDIQLSEVTFTGDLSLVGDRWHVDNAMGAGRWPVDSAINTLAYVQDPLNSKQRICQGTFLATAVSTVCGATDIMSDSKDDSKNKLCNALSTEVQFQTAPAVLGQIKTPTRDDPCAGSSIPTSCP